MWTSAKGRDPYLLGRRAARLAPLRRLAPSDTLASCPPSTLSVSFDEQGARLRSNLTPVRADSPGGYQILGKTLTPWSPWGRYDGEGHEKLFLLRNFDVVHWLPMSEEEFLKVCPLSRLAVRCR